MTGDADFDPAVWWLAERDGGARRLRAPLAQRLAEGPRRPRVASAAAGSAPRSSEQGLAEFARRGVARVGLKVDAGNPTGAVRLYERLGFVVERREAVGPRRL